jgi:Dolichyl-phosphate-mannose-protein mannosyltransferase
MRHECFSANRSRMLPKVNQQVDRRDAAVAAASAVATALVVILQNGRLTLLWDLSYILENATRIAGGDVPYRDFPFPYAPLTFAVQAVIIRLFGRALWHHIVYAAVAGGIATALAYFVVRRFTGRWSSAMLITPLIPLGIYSIFPHPFYDPDACLTVLAIAVLLLYGDSPKAHFAAGVASVLPLFVKQNIGLAFILALAGCVVISRDRGRSLPLLGGIAAGCAIGAVAVGSVFGFDNYIHWTIRFAASRRLPPVGQYAQIYTEAIVWWWIAITTSK